MLAKRVLRTAQTFAPWSADLKVGARRALRRALRRPAEADFKALALLPAPADGIHLDVGANHGQSIDAIRMHRPRAPIHAFEPNPGPRARLERRFRGDAGVRLHALALGRAPAVCTLFVPSYRGYVFDGLASLDRDEATAWLSADALIGFDPRHLLVQEVEVRVARLDDLGLAPCFLKLDVQGTGLEVLEGGVRTIEAHRPLILIEEPRRDGEIAFLARFGYRVFRFDGRHFHADETGRPNSFLVPEHHLADLAPHLARG